MNYAHPRVLWFGLVLLPLLALFLWFTWRKRREIIRQFVQNKALADLALGVSASRHLWRRVLFFSAVGLLLLGMAGPQWGFSWEEAAQRGRDILVAIDTSRSMLANDIQPDRLTRARLAALDLLQLGQYDRFGLIAFSGTAFLQCPLTFDDEAFRQSVNILQPGVIPQGGTALSEAIKTARDAFATDADENHKVLVLFTDGEDHEEHVSEAVERAASEGVKIFTVGVGTPGGELLRIPDEKGNLVYVKDEAGNVVKSRLNEQLLREVATTGNGFYIPLQGGNAMEVLYQKGLAPLPTTERDSKLMKQLKHQFQWPLALALLLLIAEIFIPDQKRPARRPDTRPGTPLPARTAALLALALFFGFTPPASASAAKAQRHYRNGEYKSALAEYQELLTKAPNDPRLRYNAGAAAYQASKFDEAIKQFEAAAASSDLDLQQQAFYNLGNAEFRLGLSDPNPQQRSALWEQAIQRYDAALKLNPQDADAQYNRELVQKKLEELKQEQKQDQKDGEDNKENDKSEDEEKQDEGKDNKSEQQQNQSQDNQSEENRQQQEQNQQGEQKDEQPQQQQQQQQQQPESSQDKENGEPKQDQAGNQKEGKNESEAAQPEGEGEEGQFAQLGKMTPAQAKQLLDAQKGEEKALLFLPQNAKPQQNQSFKDW
jgi:Ca-activated chloride channel family protein